MPKPLSERAQKLLHEIDVEGAVTFTDRVGYGRWLAAIDELTAAGLITEDQRHPDSQSTSIVVRRVAAPRARPRATARP